MNFLYVAMICVAPWLADTVGGATAVATSGALLDEQPATPVRPRATDTTITQVRRRTCGRNALSSMAKLAMQTSSAS